MLLGGTKRHVAGKDSNRICAWGEMGTRAATWLPLGLGLLPKSSKPGWFAGCPPLSRTAFPFSTQKLPSLTQPPEGELGLCCANPLASPGGQSWVNQVERLAAKKRLQKPKGGSCLAV